MKLIRYLGQLNLTEGKSVVAVYRISPSGEQLRSSALRMTTRCNNITRRFLAYLQISKGRFFFIDSRRSKVLTLSSLKK